VLHSGAAASVSQKGWQRWGSRAQGDKWPKTNLVMQQAHYETVSRVTALRRTPLRPYRLARGKTQKLAPTAMRLQVGWGCLAKGQEAKTVHEENRGRMVDSRQKLHRGSESRRQCEGERRDPLAMMMPRHRVDKP
jgi:hypothetical protein